MDTHGTNHHSLHFLLNLLNAECPPSLSRLKTSPAVLAALRAEAMKYDRSHMPPCGLAAWIIQILSSPPGSNPAPADAQGCLDESLAQFDYAQLRLLLHLSQARLGQNGDTSFDMELCQAIAHRLNNLETVLLNAPSAAP